MTISELLSKERKNRHFLQKEMALFIGCPKATYGRWERGESIPDDYYIEILSNKLDYDLDCLIQIKNISHVIHYDGYIVYKHTTPSGKVYIGITGQSLWKRWQKGEGYNYNIHFKNAIKKYGWNNIKHDILEKNLSINEAKLKEIEMISLYNSTNMNFGYNLSPGGDMINEDSIRRAIKTKRDKGQLNDLSFRMKQRWSNPNIRRNTIANMKGKKRTEEQKARMRESNARKGKPLPLETRKKLSDINKSKIGINAVRSKKVVAIDPFTGAIEMKFISAREAALKMNEPAITGISNLCNLKYGNNKKFKHGFFWCWEEDYKEGIFPIITKNDIKSNGRLKRKKEDSWMFGKTITDYQRKKISDAHRIPVMCIETKEVFPSMFSAATKYNTKPECISRQIKGKIKTAGKHTWKLMNSK